MEVDVKSRQALVEKLAKKLERINEQITEGEKDNGTLSNEYRILANQYKEKHDEKQDAIQIYDDYLVELEAIKPRIEQISADNDDLYCDLKRLE